MSKEKGFDIIDFYTVDSNLEKDGAKLYLQEDPEEKAFFVVRPYPNDDRTRLISKLYEDNQSVFKKVKTGTPEEKIAAEILDKQLTAEADATHILVGCGGMSEPYSKEFAKKCMLNTRIRDRVIRFAIDLNNFRGQEGDLKKK